ncbi:MAG TPA: alpha/beta fold hydrolase, partial [Solirubrobacteraceae bacterium]
MTLRWEPEGEARGSVALVHGVMALAETWWRIGAALAARGWRVAAVDLPGHGGDVRRDGALDLDALVDGVAARLDGPVDLLVGHSLGAIVALGLLGRDPGAARALVLEEPPGPSAIDLGALAEVIVHDAAAVRTDRAPLVAREREANPGWHPGDVERSVRGIEEADSDAIVAALNGSLRWDLAALFAGVDAPALVVAAPDAPGRFPLDPGSALRGADREAVRAALAPERFAVLEGGHCLHRDDPRRWIEVVDG